MAAHAGHHSRLALIGFRLEDAIAEAFHGDNDPARLAIAGFLVVGAVALWLADRFGTPGDRWLSELTTPSALAIGVSQALALLPGISRSGATITAGLALGLNREAAARFSFLLATPITLGAGLYGSRRLLTESHTQMEWVAIGVGFLVAALSGLVAIGFLLAWLRTRSVTVFSVYRTLPFAGGHRAAGGHRPLRLPLGATTTKVRSVRSRMLPLGANHEHRDPPGGKWARSS